MKMHIGLTASKFPAEMSDSAIISVVNSRHKVLEIKEIKNEPTYRLCIYTVDRLAENSSSKESSLENLKNSELWKSK